MRALLLLPLLLLLVSACELTLDIEVPRVDAVLVVDAPFEVGQPWRVGLSRSTPVQDGFANGLSGVYGATVEIYRGDVLVERLSNCETDSVLVIACPGQGDDNFAYYNGQTTPDAGVAYTLRVRHPDYADVTATDAAPMPIVRERLSASATRDPEQFEYDGSILEARLELSDDPTLPITRCA